MRCHFNVIGTCMCACMCVCASVCVYVLVHVCVCMYVCIIYGCHSSDDQSSCYSEVSQSISRFAHRFVIDT